MGKPGRIGDIQPFAELSEGPTTLVLKGYQQALDRFVLLKVLRPEVAQDLELVERFESEARLIARIQHPNVVAVYSHGREEDQVFFATEFVEGVSLAELLEHGPVPIDLSLYILAACTSGLCAAHETDVLHRDLKPGNIMIGVNGEVKLTDFGFGSLASDVNDEMRGTPAYMAPEVLQGLPASRASDVFSLGAILFEMLTGRPAFMGSDTGGIIDAVLHFDPAPILMVEIPASHPVHQLLHVLLERDPEKRPSSTGLLAELERLVPDRKAGEDALTLYVADPEAFRNSIRTPDGESAFGEVVVQKGTVSTSSSRVGKTPGGSDSKQTVRLTAGLLSGDTPGSSSGRPTTVLRSLLLRRYPIVVGILVLAVTFFWGWPGFFSTPSGPISAIGTLPDEDSSRVEDISDGGNSDPERSVQPVGNEIADDDPSARDSGEGPIDGDAREETQILAPGGISGAVRGVISGDTGSSDSSSTDSILPDSIQHVSASRPRDLDDVRPGSLLIDSVPWAALFVDGDSIGTTPLRVPLTLDAGRYEVVLRNPEFPDYTTEVEITSGRAQNLEVSLFEQVARVFLDISPWAIVAVDGAVRDTIPPQDHPLILRPGEHMLSLRHPSLGVWRTSLLVKAGDTRRLRYNLNVLLNE